MPEQRSWVGEENLANPGPLSIQSLGTVFADPEAQCSKL